MAKTKRRTPHGAVSILVVSRNLHLRWTYQGQRFRLSMKLQNNPVNWQAAKAKAAQIELDIARETFDPTLERYRPQPIEPLEVPQRITTIALWRLWMEKQQEEGVSLQTLANRYQTLLNLLNHFDRDIETGQDAKDFQVFLLTRQSPQTANRNIKMLATFFAWVATQYGTDNPCTALKPIKGDVRPSAKRVPFTHGEIRLILDTFQAHPSYSHYHDFVLMILSFGLRPSEAIGLQWKHVDLTQRTLSISESLSRSGERTRRVRKDRKNGVVTIVDLPDHIYTMLQTRFTQESKPDDLVFTSAKGKPINDNNFSQREWRTILKEAGVPYRPPYNCRHSMASHSIDQGLTLPETAYLLGHKDTTMVSKVYGHMVNRPQVPKMGF
jgi:integrase